MKTILFNLRSIGSIKIALFKPAKSISIHHQWLSTGSSTGLGSDNAFLKGHSHIYELVKKKSSTQPFQNCCLYCANERVQVQKCQGIGWISHRGWAECHAKSMASWPCRLNDSLSHLPHVFQARGYHSLILDQSQTYFVYKANSLAPPQFSPMKVWPSNQHRNKPFKGLWGTTAWKPALSLWGSHFTLSPYVFSYKTVFTLRDKWDILTKYLSSTILF